jgi:hypothetical protein
VGFKLKLYGGRDGDKSCSKNAATQDAKPIGIMGNVSYSRSTCAPSLVAPVPMNVAEKCYDDDNYTLSVERIAN